MNPVAALTLAACLGGNLQIQPDSSIDYGTTGKAHHQVLTSGSSTGFVILGKCSDDDTSCNTNTDCTNQTCIPTCNCNEDTDCEIAGPVGQKHCLGTLTDCIDNADCTSGAACVSHFAPPMPFNAGGTAFCVESYFDRPLTGTIDVATGEATLSTALLWRVFLGSYPASPCPRCGIPEQNPAVGDMFTCGAGPSSGEPCRVDGVSAQFGGTSFDCPPTAFSNMTGAGLLIPLGELTTGTTTRDAVLPCSNGDFPNPLEGPAKCTDAASDEDPICTSNADCRRCTGDGMTPCESNAECDGNGNCAEAPDQPVSCGFWCHCGFCDGAVGHPCFDSADCAEGEDCVAGPGLPWEQNSPQTAPNACANDGFRCGEVTAGICATTASGLCSGAAWLDCTSNADCTSFGTGVCDLTVTTCFESRITRSGDASPTNPTLAAVACMAPARSSGINDELGIPGPATITWKTSLDLCRCDGTEPLCKAVCRHVTCGNGELEPDEDCDGGSCCGSDCAFAPSTTPCRCGVGSCDPPEYCTSSAASCPADAKLPDGTGCDDHSSCTASDTCSNGWCRGEDQYCGNGTIDEACQETCDDSNTTNGDGCASWCVVQPICGDANQDASITASDAQIVLRKAVDPDVVCTACDVDGSGDIRAGDSLRVLRKSVELPVEFQCRYGRLIAGGGPCLP